MELDAQKTCDALKEKFNSKDEDTIINEAGEYIVSVYAKRGIVEYLRHLDVPLAELLGRKKIGNPGFVFFTEVNNYHLVVYGEAKYKHGKNAYDSSMHFLQHLINIIKRQVMSARVECVIILGMALMIQKK